MSTIVCIGEILWDIHADGSRTPGGAPFNVAFHCQQLGHEGIIISRLGDDELGQQLRDVLCQYGMNDQFLQADLTHSTGIVQIDLIDGEPHYKIIEDVAWDYIERDDSVVSIAEACDALVFGTLAQRAPVSRDTIQFLIEHVSASDCLRVLDPNLRFPYVDEAVLSFSQQHCDWLKVNTMEYSHLQQYGKPTDLKYHFHLSGDINEHHDLQGCVGILTQGMDGTQIHSELGIQLITTNPCTVVDTIGAGDAFTAAMLCLHLEGRTLEEAAMFASRYAARVCEHRGATPIIDRATIFDE